MKGRLFLFFVCTILSMKDFGQKKFFTNSISISGGISLPVGNFASTNLQGDLSGFANAGENIKIDFDHKLKNNWGISVAVTAQRNRLNVNSLNREFSNEKFIAGGSTYSYYNTPIVIPGMPLPNVTYTYVTYPNWNFKKHDWLSGIFSVGISKEIPIDRTQKRISLLIKPMIGLIYAKSPVEKGISITDTVVAKISETSSTAFGFAYQFNTGIKYKFSEKIFLLFNMEYSGTNKINFKNVTNTFDVIKYPNSLLNTSISESKVTVAGKQPMAILSFNIGVGFKL